MTLAELCDAIAGFGELEHERLQWHLWGVRRQILWNAALQGNKDIREEQIFPLEIDDKIRAERYKNTKPIEVTYGPE